MQFIYRAKTMSGEDAGGIKEAVDRFDLAKTLRKEGYVLVSCESLEKKKKKIVSFSLSLLGSVPVVEKMIFSRNLSVMITAGLPLSRALEVLSRQTSNKKFGKIIVSLMNEVQKGTPLSEAMKTYSGIFSAIFVAMVKVGEESGKLSESLKLISEQLERDHNLTKKIKGAMFYPSIILTAMAGIGALMLVYVVPTLTGTFKELNVELPASTQLILLLSNFLTDHFVILVLLIVVAVVAIMMAMRTSPGKKALDMFLLKAPLISSLVQKVNSARTARTLASLVSSGVDVIEALSITRDVLQNYRYKAVLERAKNEIQKGTPISDSFKKAPDLYPVMVGEMMAVGEETGKLSDMLMRLAAFYEDEVSEATKNMSTIIEPILMVIIGAAVGFFAMSMIKPMYSVMGGIQ